MHKEVKKVMLTRPKLIFSYPKRYSPFLSSPSSDNSKCLKHLREETNFMFSITCHPHYEKRTKVITKTMYQIFRSLIYGKPRVWEDFFIHIEFFFHRVVKFSNFHTP